MPYEETEDDGNSTSRSSDSDENSDDSGDSGSDNDESSGSESDSEDRRSKRKKTKKTKGSPQKEQPAPVVQPPRIEPAPVEDDLLGDLFGFDDAPPSNGGYNGPPLTMAFDSNKGQGLEMSLAFKQENGSPMMVVQAMNRSNNAISRIDIKFNKNYLGIQPTSTVPLNGQINPGQTQTVSLPLQLSQPPTPKNPLDRIMPFLESTSNSTKTISAFNRHRQFL